MNPTRCHETVGARLPRGGCLLLAAGMLACAGCASGRGPGAGVDAKIVDLAGSAGVAYERGETSRAAELYERALARARVVDDPDESARNAYNLALCRMAEGRFEEARGLLAQARALLPPIGPDTARTWIAEAEAAQGQGRMDDVRRLAQRGMDAGADRGGCAQARLLLAGTACGDSDWQRAREALALARRDLRRIDAPELQARAEGVAARLAQADGDVPGAAAALERQSGWFKRAGRFQDMAAALMAAGETYRKAGLARQAYPCLMRAAAGLKARGLGVTAKPAVAEALSIAQELNEPDWVAAATALAAEITGR